MLVAKTLLLAGTLSALTMAAPGGVAADPRTLHFVAENRQSRTVDLPPVHVSLGDQEVANGVLVDDEGKQAGTFGVECAAVVVSKRATQARCSGWAALAGGELVVAGRSIAGTAEETWAVTGGTGDYGAARGEALLHDLGRGRASVTITLVAP
jgi:hypothetical protein